MDSRTVSLHTDGLRREFDGQVALSDVSVHLAGPEIVGLAGPNASGKTTFIRCLLGLLSPTDGTCEIFGTPSTELTHAERQRIGYMPQREAIYGDLSAHENVAFFARLYGITEAAPVERALDFVALTNRADDRVGTFSGGMVRRVSLACAVVHDPDVVLLDEPTVGLDPELRTAMWDAFRARRDAGALLLVSTHYLGEATRCDRVLFLRNGRQLAFDTPAAFLDSTHTTDLEDAFSVLLKQDPSQ